MQTLITLFSTDYGLMSLATIVFILGMGAYIARYAIKHMHEEEAQHRPRSGTGA
jgi:hypothetical protein